VTNRTPQIVKQKRLYENIFRAFVFILFIPLVENAKAIMGFYSFVSLKAAIYRCVFN
jgi:hypothetical protein